MMLMVGATGLFVGVAAEAEMCEAVHGTNIVLRVVNFQARRVVSQFEFSDP